MRTFQFPKYVVPLSFLGAAAGTLVLLKDKMGGAMYKGEEKLHGKTVIVTGANTGLGKETASEMAKRGGRVIMACRDLEKCREAREEIVTATFNKNVECRHLDLASLESIRRFAHEINANEKRLDILINNAGVMGIPKCYTKEGFETHLGVNYLGPYLLTNLLVDKLKASAPSRIVNVTCVTFSRSRIDFSDLNKATLYEAKEAFSESKLALVMFTRSLAEQLKDSGVTTYSAHPGLCLTDIGRHTGMKKSSFSRTILGPFWWLLFKSPERGMQTTLYCSLDPDLASQSGEYYEECSKRRTPPNALVQEETARLLAISRRWTGLTS